MSKNAENPAIRLTPSLHIKFYTESKKVKMGLASYPQPYKRDFFSKGKNETQSTYRFYK